MWNAFVPFCAERGLDLQSLDEDHLRAFLAIRSVGSNPEMPAASGSAGLSPRYARRFLTLIDWIASHRAADEQGQSHPAVRRLLDRPEYKYANAGHKNPPPEYLNDAQSAQLIAFVTQRPDPKMPPVALAWKEVRDRTAVALMLGAGLTPGDVRALRLSGVSIEGGSEAGVPWKLALPGNGNFPARETPLAAWAGHQLAYWLVVRREHEIGGSFVFPSTRNGKQWSDTRSFLNCREVLSIAGISSDAGGLFKLRHSFALRQLSAGKSEAEVARWLGLLDVNGMARYRRLLTSPIDVA